MNLKKIKETKENVPEQQNARVVLAPIPVRPNTSPLISVTKTIFPRQWSS